MAKIADHEIIPAVLAKIERIDSIVFDYQQTICAVVDCDECAFNDYDLIPRYQSAVDRLRDFATVELLCEGLGITREEV